MSGENGNRYDFFPMQAALGLYTLNKTYPCYDDDEFDDFDAVHIEPKKLHRSSEKGAASDEDTGK